MTHDEMIAVIQAHKEGKNVQFQYKAGQVSWQDCPPSWDFHCCNYRIKPTPKRVPLGPDDFPPGTVLSFRVPADRHWRTITGVIKDGVYVAFSGEITFRAFESLPEKALRRLPGSTEWLPCWREE